MYTICIFVTFLVGKISKFFADVDKFYTFALT